MRSKLSIITMSWYNAVTIDLIRHAVRRDTFPSRGRLWLVRNCKFLPPLIRSLRDHRSRGMTATGSHINSYSLRGAQPPGEGFFSIPSVPAPIYHALALRPGGRGVSPPLHLETILPTAPHPSWLTPCHLPPGEGSPQKNRHPYHPGEGYFSPRRRFSPRICRKDRFWAVLAFYTS